MRNLAGFSFLLLFLAACSTLSQRKGPPRLDEVEQMKGLSSAQVVEKIGPPSDVQGARVFYFLSEESSYHPEPKAQVYEFIYSKDRLVDLRRR